jgi:hypothetical protein
MDFTKFIQATAGIHGVLGVIWLGISLHVIMFLKLPLHTAVRKAQAILAVLVTFAGLVLWHYLHPGAFGTREAWLAVGVVCAIAAAGLQHGMAKANERRIRALGPEPGEAALPLLKKVRLADRLAALLLAIALIAMLGSGLLR